MKLIGLEPRALKIVDEKLWQDCPFEEADGVQFLCPKCFRINGGRVGTHQVLCWKPHVPQTVNPVPGRWSWVGTSFENLTLVAASSSVRLTAGCMWHGHITNGEVTDC